MVPTDYLPRIISLLDIKHVDSIRITNGGILSDHYSLFNSPDEHALYYFPKGINFDKNIFSLIISQYSQNFKISIISSENDEWKKDTYKLNELENREFDSLIFLYFPPFLSNASFMKFKELIAHLRSDEGCPWDRKQTHKTLRTNLLEETFEVLEAIDQNDPQLLEEELGDLLLQIVLHAQIANENGDFEIHEVIQAIYKKIVHRHPHVFQNLDLKNPDDVIRNWEIIKDQDRKKKDNPKSLLSGIPKMLPSLSLAQKYQERAARVGFDWKDISPVYEKVDEEMKEVKTAANNSERALELGDLLFAVVNLVRWCGLDSESLLRETSARFRERIEFIELRAAEKKQSLYELSLEEMDSLWEQAKLNES